MDRMLQNLSPLFTDVTWGAGGSTADLSLQLALRAHNTGHVGKLLLFSFTHFRICYSICVQVI
jgi:methylenetetrahydrofolate reductase (NADPH)